MKEADQPFPTYLSRVGHRVDPNPAGTVTRPTLSLPRMYIAD